MPEFILEDGRKAESQESVVDALTKVTEVFVEPKPEKKLSKRITEKLCVCERHIEVLDEATGQVLETIVEKLCGEEVQSQGVVKSPRSLIEEKLASSMDPKKWIFLGVIAAQVLVLAYVLFFM
jgi:hypothetical protein